LIAHFHNTIIGGVVFGYFAGITYWFPKTFGFKLNEKLGKCAFWCWIVGFYTAFMPLYILGFMGMTRRLYHYDASTGWHPFLLVACLGAFIIFAGIFFQVLQLVVSIKNRNHPDYVDTTGDPWNARTLEWSIPSPPSFYNFATIPEVKERDDFWRVKQGIASGEIKPEVPHYEDIHMPKNTGLPIIIAAFSFLVGFGAIWDITWMLVSGLVGVVATALVRSFDYNIDYYVKAEEVAAIEAKHSHKG